MRRAANMLRAALAMLLLGIMGAWAIATADAQGDGEGSDATIGERAP